MHSSGSRCVYPGYFSLYNLELSGSKSDGQLFGLVLAELSFGVEATMRGDAYCLVDLSWKRSPVVLEDTKFERGLLLKICMVKSPMLVDVAWMLLVLSISQVFKRPLEDCPAGFTYLIRDFRFSWAEQAPRLINYRFSSTFRRSLACMSFTDNTFYLMASAIW